METHVVLLSHATVRNYLMQQQQQGETAAQTMYQFNAELTDAFLARSCIEYLSHCALHSWVDKHYPLARYSLCHWYYHARHNKKLLSSLGTKVKSIFSILWQSPESLALLTDTGVSGNSYSCEKGLRYRLRSRHESIHYPIIPRAQRFKEAGAELQVDPERADVRLFVMLPAKSRDAPLECRMQVVSLRERPVYTILSYVNERVMEPAGHDTILVNGYPIDITKSFANALRDHRQRNQHTFGVFWTEQLCVSRVYDQLRYNIIMTYCPS